MSENVPFSDKYTGVIVKEGKCEEVTHNQGDDQVEASQHGKCVHLSELKNNQLSTVDTMRAGI